MADQSEAPGSSTQLPMRQRVTEYIKGLQNAIVTELETIEGSGKRFKREQWERKEGGGGISCTFAEPESVIEKAGVNISMIEGTLSAAALKQLCKEHSSLAYDPDSNASRPFFAGGISLIVHPRNPNAPTVHMNYRYFEVTEPEDTNSVIGWWFGGITDLTPSYLFEEDCIHFHQTLKDMCDTYDDKMYPVLKKSCDGYFYIKHRDEHRGIGGIRFDDLNDELNAALCGGLAEVQSRSYTAEEQFKMVQSLGDAFLPSYIPILRRRVDMPHGERQRRWQLIRRGRYVEFNLVIDRGTKFGLATPGVRIENVLMSLPETARWEYMSELGEEEGTPEAEAMVVLRKPKEWAT